MAAKNAMDVDNQLQSLESDDGGCGQCQRDRVSERY